MTWSTRQLAELAGTTVRTVRHYHDMGLLDEPERGSNGYKQYGVPHLLRVLRIKRLADMGLPLSRIAAMGAEEEHPYEALEALDAELATTIERLQRVRVELALILRQGTPTDLPAELGSAGAAMSDADRSYTVIMSRVMGPSAMSSLREILHAAPGEPGIEEFDRLPADAADHTRTELARRMAPYVRNLQDTYPELGSVADSPVGPERATEALALAVRDLYNDAQVDVLLRVNRILTEPDTSLAEPGTDNN